MGAGIDLFGLRKDGSEFSVDIMLSPVETGEGRFVLVVVRDVSEKKRADEALRRSEQQFRALFEFSPDGILVTDAKGRITHANQQLEKLFGYTSAELQDQAVEILLPETFRAVHPMHRQSYSAQSHVRPLGAGLELSGRRKDGSEFPVDIMLSSINSLEGRRILAVVRDISEKKRTLESLEISERQTREVNQELLLSAVRQHELAEVAEKLNAQLQVEITERKRMEGALLNSEKLAVTARFADTMAHEINNPLAAITNLTFLLAPLQTSPEAQAYIATLKDAVSGLSRIATQMVKFHHDSNKPTEFKLSEVLGDVSEFYRLQAERQGVVVNQRIEIDGLIVGFRSEIVHVVSNLLLNALEATPAGGQVGVHLYPAPPWLREAHNHWGYCLSIADTGTGIDPQRLKRVFEAFFTTKGDKGTGLGLWVCRGIVDRVGGSIRVWSTCRPGRSRTCFSVFLPAEEATFTPIRRRYERDKSACPTKE
jgi:PAS domain S-box-containing protein